MTGATERAWEELRDGLRAWLRRRVGDEHLAEDLLQETFLRVHDRIDALRDEARLAPWVQRVARSVLVDHLRGAGAPAEGLPDDGGGPAGEGEAEPNFNREVEGWLRARVARLPPEYREAVELAEVRGLPHRAVAERLGLTPSGARSRIQRGRARLRALLLSCCHLDFDRRGNVVGYAPNRGCADCRR